MKATLNRSDVLSLIRVLSDDGVSVECIVENLSHPVGSVRAAALRAVGRQGGEAETLLPALEAAYKDPENQSAVWGKLKIAHLALEAIVRVDPEHGDELLDRLTRENAEDSAFVKLYLRRNSSVLDVPESNPVSLAGPTAV